VRFVVTRGILQRVAPVADRVVHSTVNGDLRPGATSSSSPLPAMPASCTWQCRTGFPGFCSSCAGVSAPRLPATVEGAACCW